MTKRPSKPASVKIVSKARGLWGRQLLEPEARRRRSWSFHPPAELPRTHGGSALPSIRITSATATRTARAIASG